MTRATQRRVLLVEDEPALVVTVSDRLLSEGFEVESVGDGEAAVARALEGGFDLILLDVALPGKNGFDVCRDLRQRGLDVPILMLTARSQITDKVVGLKLGADDYVTKPFEMLELLARIEALLRRAHNYGVVDADGLISGPLRVDFRSARVTRDGKVVELSALEYKLLRYFIENRGAVMSRNELLDKVWGYDATPTTRTVDVHVSSLRQKLEQTPAKPELIVTVHGLGYKFVG